MKLPEDSIIAVTTLVDDLLQPGKSADLLASGGYTLGNWSELESDLRALLAVDALLLNEDASGKYYQINGNLKSLPIQTLWLWEPGEEVPHFITLTSM